MSTQYETYDPSETINGHTLTIGDILAMDCAYGMPAVTVESGETRYATTEAEYSQRGAHVPVAKDIEIGCEEYQRIAKLGLTVQVQACVSCPLYSAGA